jgi:cysteine desulfuration protein SufE
MMDLDRLYKSFELLNNWDDRFLLIIDLGKKIPKLDEVDKTEANRVQGCFSTVHMTLDITDDLPPKIHFKAESDAFIVNGLIAILHIVYDGKTAAEMSQLNIEEIFAKLGLERHLSPNRRNGFFSMVERLKSAIHQTS